MSSSECSRDQPSIVFEDQVETEKECVALCQTYASISVIGCTFAAWEAGVVLGKCTLYKEPFANFLAHCQLLAGPPDVSGCSVDHPAENSCDGIRFLGPRGPLIEPSSVPSTRPATIFPEFID